MDRLHGLLGIALLLGLAVLCSNNRRKISVRLVLSGLMLQVVIALVVFKVSAVARGFSLLGEGMGKFEGFARQGAAFVYGGIGVQDYTGKIVNYAVGGFVIALNVTATIILVCAVVAVLYHFGVMQRVVAVIARAMNVIMRVSGAEALSNVASAFVGQIEAQVMIRPYLAGMTNSELLASMSGSLACISGGMMVIYARMGAQAGMDIAPKLITASLMAAPGALVVAKIIFPETQESQTLGKVKLEVKSDYSNVIDAVSRGAGDGFTIAMNVLAMLMGFIAMIACIDWLLTCGGHLFAPGFDLTLNWIFGKIFYPIAWAMGVPGPDIQNAASLLGQKLTLNEFVAFQNLTNKSVPLVTEKGLLILSIALCGFANFASVGMQIGGIGALAPERRSDLAKLGLKALLCGTLASYLSATIAGIVI